VVEIRIGQPERGDLHLMLPKHPHI